MFGQLLRQGKDDSVTKHLFENEQIEPFYSYCRKSGFNDLRKAIDETFDSTSKSKRLFDDCYQELFSILTIPVLSNNWAPKDETSDGIRIIPVSPMH